MPIYWVETFSNWRNGANIFIESGTYLGDGLKFGLRAGFTELYTVEINAKDRIQAMNRYKTEPELVELAKDKKIEFILGDSSIEFENIFAKINGKAGCYLDAHFGAVNLYQFDSLPLMKELSILQKYSEKVETIWIDDIRLTLDFEGHFPWTRQQLIDKLLQINPNFQITYTRGFQDDDIMVAFLKH